jgi:hypothetical protein
MNDSRQDPGTLPEPEARRGGGYYHWMGALILIALGVVFLLRETGVVALGDNWWVIFLLLPAAGLFVNAWQRYQAQGGQTGSAVWGQVLGGVVLLVVALTFLFNWNWDLIWPVFLIIGGIYILVQRRS